MLHHLILVQTFEENSPKWSQDCQSSLQNAQMVKLYLICVLTTFFQTVMVKKPHAHGPACSRWQIWDRARLQSCLFNPFLKTSVLNQVAEQSTWYSLMFSSFWTAAASNRKKRKITDYLTLVMEKNKRSGVHAFANTLHLIKWTLNPVTKMANGNLICVILQQENYS